MIAIIVIIVCVRCAAAAEMESGIYNFVVDAVAIVVIVVGIIVVVVMVKKKKMIVDCVVADAFVRPPIDDWNVCRMGNGKWQN